MEDGEDPSERCKGCRFEGVLRRYDDIFMAWYNNMIMLYELKKAGYPFEKNDLTFAEWRALRILEEYFERIQWQSPTQQR